MSNGFYLMYREWMNNPVFGESEPFCDRLAWLWMIEQASYEPHKIRYKSDMISVERGQIPTSYRRLQSTWGWGVHRVRNFLQLLEHEGMITRKIETGFLIITICNYSKYQEPYKKSETPATTLPITLPITLPTTNIKKGKEIKETDDVVARARDEKNLIHEIHGWIVDRIGSPSVFYPTAPIAGWLKWGADFEADIKPVVEWFMAKGRGAPRSLTWLDDQVAKSIKDRTKPMPDAPEPEIPRPPTKEGYWDAQHRIEQQVLKELNEQYGVKP